MNDLITSIKTAYPKLALKPSDTFYWSPQSKEIHYKKKARGKIDQWSLLHEVGHALLDHRDYDSDFMLVRLEIEAWQKARELATVFGIHISEDHIEECLDTYRDWLDKRSICPNCSTKSIQQSDFTHYRCFNCHMSWRVTKSRFCRTYRMSDNSMESKTIFI